MPTTYTEREVAQIIERAVVRQEEARRREGAGGLTLEEIERIGHEVGIDPEHLRAAAAEVDAGAAERDARQTTTHNHVERWTTGPLDPVAWEDAVERLRDRLGTDYGMWFGRTQSGVARQVGLSHEWEHTSGLGVHTRVVVSERGERTRIRLSQQVGSASSPVEGVFLGLLSMLLLGPLAAGAGIGLLGGAAGWAVTAVLALVLFAASSYAIYRADVGWRKRRLGGLEALSDELAEALAAPAPARTAGEERTPAPALDLDGIDLEDTDDVRPQGRDRLRTR